MARKLTINEDVVALDKIEANANLTVTDYLQAQAKPPELHDEIFTEYTSMSFAIRLSEELHCYNSAKEQSMAEFATGIEIANSSISEYKTASVEPKIIALAKFSKQLNVSADYLLGLTNIKTTDKRKKAICEFTGMDEASISQLNTLKRTGHQFELDILSRLINEGHLPKLLTQLKNMMVYSYMSVIVQDKDSTVEESEWEYKFQKAMSAIYTELREDGLSYFFGQSKAEFEKNADSNIELLRAMQSKIDTAIDDLEKGKQRINVTQEEFNATVARNLILKEAEK